MSFFPTPRSQVHATYGPTLVASLAAFWHILLAKWVAAVPYAGFVLYWLTAVAHFVVFCGLAYLLCWSLPDWAKACVQKLLSRAKPVSGAPAR